MEGESYGAADFRARIADLRFRIHNKLKDQDNPRERLEALRAMERSQAAADEQELLNRANKDLLSLSMEDGRGQTWERPFYDINSKTSPPKRRGQSPKLGPQTLETLRTWLSDLRLQHLYSGLIDILGECKKDLAHCNDVELGDIASRLAVDSSAEGLRFVQSAQDLRSTLEWDCPGCSSRNGSNYIDCWACGAKRPLSFASTLNDPRGLPCGTPTRHRSLSRNMAARRRRSNPTTPKPRRSRLASAPATPLTELPVRDRDLDVVLRYLRTPISPDLHDGILTPENTASRSVTPKFKNPFHETRADQIVLPSSVVFAGPTPLNTPRSPRDLLSSSPRTPSSRLDAKFLRRSLFEDVRYSNKSPPIRPKKQLAPVRTVIAWEDESSSSSSDSEKPKAKWVPENAQQRSIQLAMDMAELKEQFADLKAHTMRLAQESVIHNTAFYPSHMRQQETQYLTPMMVDLDKENHQHLWKAYKDLREVSRSRDETLSKATPRKLRPIMAQRAGSGRFKAGSLANEDESKRMKAILPDKMYQRWLQRKMTTSGYTAKLNLHKTRSRDDRKSGAVFGFKDMARAKGERWKGYSKLHKKLTDRVARVKRSSATRYEKEREKRKREKAHERKLDKREIKRMAKERRSYFKNRRSVYLGGKIYAGKGVRPDNSDDWY